MLKVILYGGRILRMNSTSCFTRSNLQCRLRSCLCLLNRTIFSKSSRFGIVSRKRTNSEVNDVNRHYLNIHDTQPGALSRIEFESKCNETLDSLCEYFEEIFENCPHLKSCDVAYSDGVLTVHFGNEFGTYVINRQTSNRQIWLSSPTSGPKRYDFVASKNLWIYKHDNRSLHELLQEEIPNIVKVDVNFFNCANAR